MEMNSLNILARSGRYTQPRRENEALPLVYGDCTLGGSGGVWSCPCIDTASYVYAVAGHPLLSLADGNSVTVYDRNDEVLGGWTFNEDHDYESQGAIATLTFSSSQQANEPTHAAGDTDVWSRSLASGRGIRFDAGGRLGSVPASFRPT